MTVDRAERLVSSVVVLATVAVSHPKCPLYVSDSWLFLTALVGAVQLQGVFTGVRPLAMVLRKLGVSEA